MNNFFTQKEIENIINIPPYIPSKTDTLIRLKDELNNEISFYYNKSTGVICVKEIIINNLDK